MTKKDFELIAVTLQDCQRAESEQGAEAVCRVADRFASYLRATNPRFDRDRFLRACVPGANVRAGPK